MIPYNALHSGKWRTWPCNWHWSSQSLLAFVHFRYWIRKVVIEKGTIPEAEALWRPSLPSITCTVPSREGWICGTVMQPQFSTIFGITKVMKRWAFTRQWPSMPFIKSAIKGCFSLLSLSFWAELPHLKMNENRIFEATLLWLWC